MLSTFNCGIGMAFIISKNELKKTQKFFENINEEIFIIGKTIKNIRNGQNCKII